MDLGITVVELIRNGHGPKNWSYVIDAGVDLPMIELRRCGGFSYPETARRAALRALGSTVSETEKLANGKERSKKYVDRHGSEVRFVTKKK